MKIAAATFLAVLVWTALPPSVVAEDRYCAGVNEKAIQCGATNPSRPKGCCSGLQCAPGNVQKHCIAPSDLPPPPMCAAETERAINCGALWAYDRAHNCCDGLICHPGNAKVTCANPVNLAPEELYNCAAEGDRAVACGATMQIGRAQECCEGYICHPGNAKMTCTAQELVPLEVLSDCAAEGERAQECGASTRNKAGCCAGFVCTPGNAKVTCTAPENIPPPPTCAAEGDRAINCGAPALADGSRPRGCCGGLICSPGNAKMICVSPETVDPSVFSDCAGDQEGAIECGAAASPGRKNRCCGGYVCSPDPLKDICVGEATVDPTNVIKAEQTCALEGERALDCGALAAPGRHQSCCGGYSCEPGNVKVTCTANENIDPVEVLKAEQTCALEAERALDCGALAAPGRHQSCCSGYSCEPGNVKVTCTANENLPAAPTCGTEGVKATSCGALPDADRPESCCNGFVCHPGPQKVFCTSTSLVTPTSTTPDGAFCAAAGERSLSCGATNPSRPASCCPGHICDFSAGVRCVVDPLATGPKPTTRPAPFPTLRPTARPIMAPTPATLPQTKKPTAKPTKKPTRAPTDSPTVTPGNPTSSPVEASFGHAIFTSLAISDDVPEAEYASIGQTLLDVTNDMIRRKVGFDVQMREDDDGRRLVLLQHGSSSLSLVPMNIPDQRQEDAGFSWVAYRMSYTVKKFDGLGKSEVKEMIDEGWTESIEDGSLLAELQSQDPDILGASVFGQESKANVGEPEPVTDVSEPEPVDTRPTSPPTKDETAFSVRDEDDGSGSSTTTPWWVWFIVGLVGLAVTAVLVFFVLAKRRTKSVRRQVSEKGELMVDSHREDKNDNNMSNIIPAAKTFDTESSDEGHKDAHPNEAFAQDQTFDTTFPSFEVPEDEQRAPVAKDEVAWGEADFSMEELAKQPGW